MQSSGAEYTVSARDQNFFFKPATRTRGTAKIFTKGMKMIDGQDWDQMTHCARGSCQKFSHALMLLRAQWKKKDSLPFGNQVKDWHSWFSAVFSPTKLGCAWVYPQRTVWVRKVGMWYRTEPFFSRLQKMFSALGRKYYIMLTINFCILAIYFGTHEYLEQNPILLLNSLMMCLKICEKFFWIIM